MDRFFSKLDLRDIKIKPEGTRFLPTDDDAIHEESDEAPEPPTDHFAPSPVSQIQSSEASESVTDPNSPPLASPNVDDAPIEEPPFFANPSPPSEYQNGAVPSHLVADDHVQMPYNNGEVLKVSAKSRPSAVAGAIAGVVREAGRAEVQAIGAGATNQAVKAVAIARDYLLESGIDAVCVPAFIDVIIDNEERTAIRLVVETR